VRKPLYKILHNIKCFLPVPVAARSAAARLLRLWVRILPGASMFVCCECCVLSGRGLCDGLITRPEKSYRLWCVIVCDLETPRMRRLWPVLGRSGTEKMLCGPAIVVFRANHLFYTPKPTNVPHVRIFVQVHLCLLQFVKQSLKLCNRNYPLY